MDEQIVDQAMQWHAAAQRGDCDWAQFTAWLESAPSHRQAYEEIALLDDSLARHQSALAGALAAPAPSRAYQNVWLRVALAAGVALVALVVGWPRLPFGTGPVQSYQASAAASQTVKLHDGTQIVLARGSSLRVAGRHEDQLDLVGAAYFDVPHDPDRKLVVGVGDFRVQDIGTRFEIIGGGRQLKVVVAEGEVSVALPGRASPVRLQQGQRLLVSGDPAVAEFAGIAADDVAGWRDGRLVFQDEPLSLVVLQLSRFAGSVITVDPAVADRRFSGVLTIGDGSRLVEELEQIMGLVGRREGDTVHLAAAAAGQ